MTNDSTPPLPSAVPVREIPTRDANVANLFPAGFEDLYEVHSYRNAAHILAAVCNEEFAELLDALMRFRIKTEDMVKAGGNKTEIAKAVEKLFHPLGWNETRIVGELQITRISRFREGRQLKSGLNKGQTKYETRERRDYYHIPGFVNGHKIDFVKERVAFDLEWNSKDQIFDRDLYAMRTFYECNIVTVGVLLTRGASLRPIFEEIQNRVNIKDFSSKFGASTTWMRQLTNRLNAGRGGGCPVLALGITPAVVSDFDDWKAKNKQKRKERFNIEDDGNEGE